MADPGRRGPDKEGRDESARAARMADEIAAAGRKAELAPPPRSRNPLVRGIDYFVEALAVTVLTGIVLLLFVNAAGRYLFASPIGWAEEVATGLVVWLAIMGAFISVRRRDLIVVRVVVEKFPARAQRVMSVVTTLVGCLGLAYLAWNGLVYLQTFGGDTTPYLGLPQGFFFAAVPVGVTAIILALIGNLFRGGDDGAVPEQGADGQGRGDP